MRSTRRSEAYAGLVALGLFAAVAVTIAILSPDPPVGPRYMGAGHETPQRGGTFVFHHESDVRGFDPLKSFDELSNMGIKLLFEGLLDYDRDTMELVPRLAVAVPEASEDGRTYRFELRRGVRFADSEVFPGGRGRELTAEDVRWSLEKMLHPDTASPGVTFFELIEGLAPFRAREASHVAGIRVIDRYAIEIELTRPDQTFLFAMAMTFAAPVAREAYAHYGDEVARHPVGTGAYVLEEWEPGVSVVFRRNPDYFLEGQPYPDRQIYTLNLERHAAVMRFRNGDLDHIHRQTPSDFRALREMEAWAPYRVMAPQPDVWGVVMNCQLAPFDDVHVRRAVAFALNRPRWRRSRANRLAIQGQPIPRVLPGYVEDLEGEHVFDLARAREEMRLAGHPDGLDEPVEVWLGEGDVGRHYGELIQADLREIGISVRLKQVAFPIFLQETGKPRTAQMVFTGWSMDFPDPSNFLDILFHSRSIREEDSTNRAFYSSSELDRILDAARVERDRARRMDLYRRASEIIVRDAPWAFMFSNETMEMWQPYVRNYRPHAVWDNFYRDLWLDLPRRRVASAPTASTTRMALFTPFSGAPTGRR